METNRPIDSYAQGTESLAKALAVGLAWPTGSKITYLKTNSDLILILPSSYSPVPATVMWRIEIRTTGGEQHEQAVADAKEALATLSQVDATSIDTLDLGRNGNDLYWSQVFFNLLHEQRPA